jgi:predicted dehydrogenase
MREVLDDKTSIGELKRITTHFSFNAPPEFFRENIRARSEMEPYGSLGDLGWYCIRFALWTMKWQLPRAVTGRVLAEFKHADSAAPVPTEFSGELLFDGGVSSGFYCSFISALEEHATISGTQGYLRVDDFVAPFHGSESVFEVHHLEHNIVGCDYNMEPQVKRFSVPEHSNSHPTAQETNMIRNFVNQVRSGKLNELWPEMSLKTQQVMHACFESAKRGNISVAI